MESKEEKKSLSQEQDSAKSLSINSRLFTDPESHLQSLGFTIQNGQARFRLDEDAPLYCNAASSNYCDVDADDTLSFVVLGKDSLDSIQQSSLASYVDIQQKSISTDYDSMIASWDSTEVHHKLNELLQENTKLKETLKRNNIAMKQQFNTLAIWQEEIMKVYQNHKKKFAETRELINYLKKENTELKMRLSSELTGHTQMGHEILDACDKQNNVKENKTSNLEEGLSKSALYELERILNESIEENAKKETVTSKSFHTVANSEEQNADKRSFEEERMALNKERENLEAEKKSLDDQRKNIEVEYKNLNDAKDLLQQQKIGLEEEKSSLDQQSQLYETHYKDALEKERNEFELKFNELVMELGILHESVDKKAQHIQKLEAELAQHKENIDILETQLKLYEEDFNQERKLKENLLQEKNALDMDLQKQIDFNKQLQAEFRRRHISVDGICLEPPEISTLVCPLCHSTFNSMNNLVTHIDLCLGP
ncbi:NF-kappa-B essential modulator [Anthophora retusa]